MGVKVLKRFLLLWDAEPFEEMNYYQLQVYSNFQ